MAEIYDIDPVAAGNNDAPPDGFPENMQFSEVNNAARELMAALARYVEAQSGLITTGVGDAYVLTIDQNLAAYADGQHFVFQADKTNTGAPTLNVTVPTAGALGATPVVDASGVALGAGAIETGGVYIAIYRGTNFRLIGQESAASIAAKYEGLADVNRFTDALLTKLNGIGSATDTAEGLVELATNAETIAGTDTVRATTSAGVAAAIGEIPSASAATESTAGVAEIATQAETDAGTDDARFITPLKLANATSVSGGIASVLTARRINSLTIPAATGTETADTGLIVTTLEDNQYFRVEATLVLGSSGLRNGDFQVAIRSNLSLAGDSLEMRIIGSDGLTSDKIEVGFYQGTLIVLATDAQIVAGGLTGTGGVDAEAVEITGVVRRSSGLLPAGSTIGLAYTRGASSTDSAQIARGSNLVVTPLSA